MDNDIVPANYLTNSIKGIIGLGIYWVIVYFLYTRTFKDKSISAEHLLGTIEFISAIAIIICLVLFLTKFLGSSFLGIILSFSVLIAICLYGAKFMNSHNISDNYIAYFFLAIGIIFNLSLLSKIIMNIRYYILSKKIISINESNDDDFDSYIQ